MKSIPRPALARFPLALASLALAWSVLAAGALWAQTGSPEEEALRHALSDSNNSPQGYIRELTAFLDKFPQSQRRSEVEGVLFRSALNLKDLDRIAAFGENILARDPDNRMVLENVTAAELKLGKEPHLSKALAHARHLEQIPGEKSPGGTGPEEARRRVEEERAKARALLYIARATGLLGKAAEAAPIAVKSFDTFPNAESAREAANWLAEAGNHAEAVRYLADAFIMPDTKVSDDDRASDRLKLGEMYQKWKGSDAGLGDLILSEYDRTSALLAERRMALKQVDPNLQAASPLEFTLSALEGAPLKLASLQGKVIVMDFWATWCGPCRVQHPLFEKVKERFRGHPGVVFLAVNADEDRTAVAPFVKAEGWSRETYFEDGLAALLRVNSLPTTLIFDKNGKLMDRMIGFLPDRFTEQLTKEIGQALGSNAEGKEGSRGGS